MEYPFYMNAMDGNQTYFFVATCIASVFGFILAFVINRFVNKLDEKLDRADELFAAIQEEISQLKEIQSVQGNRIEHLEDKVYPVRYPKRDKDK